jgi:alpha-ribazole phosphatase
MCFDMEIYLIRHTTPSIEAGVCYGQSDLDVNENFKREAELIAKVLPPGIENIISSPLQRCKKLAAILFPGRSHELNDNLKEIHCGDWEFKKWDDIPKETLNPWMKEFVRWPFPNGESYEQLYKRVTTEFAKIAHNYRQPVALVCHGGVIRCILCYITKTPLERSFERFKIPYGSVVKLVCSKDCWLTETLL